MTAVGSSATWSPGGLSARGVDFAVLSSQFLGPLYAIDQATEVRRSGDRFRFVLPSLTVRTVGWLAFTRGGPPPTAGPGVVTRRFREVRAGALVHHGAVTRLAMLLVPRSPRTGPSVVVVRYRDLADAPSVPGLSP